MLAAAAQPGECAIDVGCGTGGTTATLARAVGAAGPSAGHVLGVDISRPLIEAARAQNVANATFMVGDATVQPFDAQSVDLVFARFGVMFFADPVAAFRNLRRALKLAVGWSSCAGARRQKNPWGLVPVRAAQPFLPPIRGPARRIPASIRSAIARVERILGEAGFGAPHGEPVDRPVWMGSSVAEVVEGSGRSGPLARAFADATPAARAQAQAAIAKDARPCQRRRRGAAGACWSRPPPPTGMSNRHCRVPVACWAAGIACEPAYQRPWSTSRPSAAASHLVLAVPARARARMPSASPPEACWATPPRPAVYIATAEGWRYGDGDPHHGASFAPRWPLDDYREPLRPERGAASGAGARQPVAGRLSDLWLPT